MRRARHVRRLGLVLGIAGLGLVGVWSYLRGSLPRSRGAIEVAGLGATARIVRDADGLPHIHAEDDADAVFALGFAHAQDRLWQMELNRRIAAGRLAEVFGAEALETDRFLRTLGLYRAAEASLDHLQPETRRILDAYAAGVNAFLTSGRRLPPEFALLGVAPEPWRPADSLGWAKMMSWDLAEDWDLELLRLRLVGLLGEARAAELLPSVPSAGPTILDAAELPRSRIDGLLALDDRLRGALGLRGLDVGSNNWVVAGRHSASGGALLANDPHLGAQIPSIWYLAELHGDRMHVVGATLPGLPGVVLGRNRDIAWGATNLNPDVQDLYVERLDPKDPSRYRFEERWEAMTVIRETIRIKGAEPVQWAARATRHGPLISDVLDDAPAPLAPPVQASVDRPASSALAAGAAGVGGASASKALETSVPRSADSCALSTASSEPAQSGASPASPARACSASAKRSIAGAASGPLSLSSARSSRGLRSSSSCTKAASSRCENCSSLIACSSCGVITRAWPWRIISRVDNAISHHSKPPQPTAGDHCCAAQ